ncbi:MAG TPA: glucose-6-phosphate dehydrogenase [Rhizomicrobium sp.]|jgi:glucose-6-phosphate 1-dehydrogenase|nr:glucose-6-phosphate dehydrogenase [Rhizomicrobium sp.]
MAETAKPAPNCAMVIFGANGDLTKRLVVPALYNLAKSNLLPQHFAIVGVDHNEKNAEDWRCALHDFLQQTLKSGKGEFEGGKLDDSAWKRVAGAMSYLTGDFTKDDTYSRLADHLKKREQDTPFDGNVLFYLATADRFFGTIVDELGKAKLVGEDGHWRRVVIEKPFGHDLPSAKELNARVTKVLREEQIYRIDHFLGKETVQNIMALRFANGLFEPIWNRDRIDHIQITVAESIGIGTRGKFYEQTGALRDMVPNHLFQLVAMTAMEPPVSFDAEAVRAKKAEVFQAVHPLTAADAVRGQYADGKIGDHSVVGYRKEENVDPDSSIETYVALKLRIDNWRWAGVPFYLRTGKRMPKRTTEIAIRFKRAPYLLFRDTPMDELSSDWMILQIQPDEGIRLRFNAKVPGPTVTLEGVAMDFKYSDWFKQAPAVGYETLLYDCFIGDATLFQRADQVEAAWAVVQPLLDAWTAAKPDDFPNYAAGTPGPKCADELIAGDGRKWRPL